LIVDWLPRIDGDFKAFVSSVAVAGKLDMRALWAIARQETWLCNFSNFRSASKLDFQSEIGGE